jgi:hypothetical protein
MRLQEITLLVYEILEHLDYLLQFEELLLWPYKCILPVVREFTVYTDTYPVALNAACTQGILTLSFNKQR